MTRRGPLTGASRDAETAGQPVSRRPRIGQPASIRGFVAREIVVRTALDPFLSRWSGRDLVGHLHVVEVTAGIATDPNSREGEAHNGVAELAA